LPAITMRPYSNFSFIHPRQILYCPNQIQDIHYFLKSGFHHICTLHIRAPIAQKIQTNSGIAGLG